MLKAVVLQNFATIGTSDITKHLGKNYWTTVAISQHLIDEVWAKHTMPTKFILLVNIIRIALCIVVIKFSLGTSERIASLKYEATRPCHSKRFEVCSL